MANYWTQDTNDAVTKYNASTDDRERNDIFTTQIYPALMYMALSQFSKYGLEKSSAYEAVTQCAVKLHMVDQTMGTAYSFCTMVIKNYFLRTIESRNVIQRKINNFINTAPPADHDSDTEEHNERVKANIEDFKTFLKTLKLRKDASLYRDVIGRILTNIDTGRDIYDDIVGFQPTRTVQKLIVRYRKARGIKSADWALTVRNYNPVLMEKLLPYKGSGIVLREVAKTIATSPSVISKCVKDSTGRGWKHFVKRQ